MTKSESSRKRCWRSANHKLRYFVGWTPCCVRISRNQHVGTTQSLVRREKENKSSAQECLSWQRMSYEMARTMMNMDLEGVQWMERRSRNEMCYTIRRRDKSTQLVREDELLKELIAEYEVLYGIAWQWRVVRMASLHKAVLWTQKTWSCSLHNRDRKY